MKKFPKLLSVAGVGIFLSGCSFQLSDKPISDRGRKMKMGCVFAGLTILASLVSFSCKVPYSSMGEPTITEVEYVDSDEFIVHCRGDYISANYIQAFLKIENRTNSEKVYTITGLYSAGEWSNVSLDEPDEGYRIGVDIRPAFEPGETIHFSGKQGMLNGSGEFTVPSN